MNIKAKDHDKRQWWAVTEDFAVREVTGYSCGPDNPNMWWCPELGFTGTEGYHLFETREKALAKAISGCEAGLETLQRRLEDLRQHRREEGKK